MLLRMVIGVDMRLMQIGILVLALGGAMRAGRGQSMPAMPGMGTAPAASASAPAALPKAADVTVTLSTETEEGKKQLVATIKRAGKPVENAIVSFGVKRTFGRLELGRDTTIDDGTAAIAFPSNLPGGPNGELEISAMVQGPLSQWGASAEAKMPGGTPKFVPAESFPRALWSPYAPVSLIAAIAVLVAGAWGAYVFVVYQLMTIRRGATK